MTKEQKIIRAKVGLLELARQLGNVSQACKMMGYSRDSFYRFKEHGYYSAEAKRVRRDARQQYRLLRQLTLLESGCHHNGVALHDPSKGLRSGSRSRWRLGNGIRRGMPQDRPSDPILFPYAFLPGRSSDHVHTARTCSGRSRAQSHHERPPGLEPGGNSFEAYSAAAAQQHQPQSQAPLVRPTTST